MIPDSRPHPCNPRSASALVWLAALALGGLSTQALAVDIIEGGRLYANPRYQGETSCATSTCHGPDPTTNLNRVRSAANFPAAIVSATQVVPEMFFLRDRFSTAQLNDLAAFIADPRSTGALPVVTLSSSALAFDAVNLGTTSGVRILTLTNTGAAPLQLSAITISAPEFARAIGTCTPTIALAVFTSCSMGISFTPTIVGTRSATLTLSHNGSPGSSAISLSGIGAIATASATRAMIEYRHSALDYYFLTSRGNEISLLDSLSGWARTGKSFNVYAAPLAGTTGINRYYFDQVAFSHSRGSHFYTLVQTEKDGLDRLNPGNGQTPGLPYNEGIDSYAFAPIIEGVGGSCAPGQIPVYRVFRGQTRFPDNPNHRFTTDTAVYNAFVALGWDGEGVKFCAPG